MNEKISYFPTWYQSWKKVSGNFFFFLAFIAYYICNLLLPSTLIYPSFCLSFLLPMAEETSVGIFLNQPKTTTHFDNPTLKITTKKLNRHNYLEWSQFAKLFLKSRGKIGYLHGTIELPKQFDPSFESWDAENSMIMSWMLYSMQPEIGKPFLFLSSAKEVWDAVSQRYSKKWDATQIYELKTLIHVTEQKGLSMTTYYNTLKVLWQELDLYQHIEMESTANATRLAEMIKQDRIF